METAQELINAAGDLDWDEETFRKAFYPKPKVKTLSMPRNASYGFKMTYRPQKKPTAEEVVEALR